MGGAAGAYPRDYGEWRCFNRRGDSLGGAAINPLIIPLQPLVSIAGAILWGVLRPGIRPGEIRQPVSIAGAILWGVLRIGGRRHQPLLLVSIAGAILWGVLPDAQLRAMPEGDCFNRRGDSLGGAAGDEVRLQQRIQVSIAGAILWGVLQGERACSVSCTSVSIAGAILWGVLRCNGLGRQPAKVQFQSQGRFFGGCCGKSWANWRSRWLFQSQGRFFGGCCKRMLPAVAAVAMVSIAGAILWGVLRGRAGPTPGYCSCFNRRGDSLGGAATNQETTMKIHYRFNRRGDSLGGAAPGHGRPQSSLVCFNRRGDSLGGAAIALRQRRGQ